MHSVILQEEGEPRPLYLSEIGWSSNVDRQVYQRREEFQADSLRAGLETAVADPLVELACWFCTQDFVTEAGEMKYGLYRPGSAFLEARKPAFAAFSAVCASQVEEEDRDLYPEYTNQQLINAFYRAAGDLGLDSRWSLMSKAGRSLGKLAANRKGRYEGPPVAELSRLTRGEKDLVQKHLDAEVPRAQNSVMFSLSAADVAPEAIPKQDSEVDINLDLILTLQSQILGALERNNRLLEAALGQWETSPPPQPTLRKTWKEFWASLAAENEPDPEPPQHT
jgi:hypothetical protein